MEPTSDTDLEREKLRLEGERLTLERQRQLVENRFLRRNSSVIIASLVPLVVAIISVVQVRNSSLNDRRERLINYVKFINDNVRELRASDDVMLHRQTAYMTSAVLDDEDRCPTLAYIANTVAKNRTIREIYEREADRRGCERTGAAVGAVQTSLIPIAAADNAGPQAIRAIYLYRQKDIPAATAAAQDVMRKLNELGYNIPGENDAPSAITQNEIRFFNKRDAAAAKKVQAQLAQAVGKEFIVTDHSSTEPGRPGFLEIYIAQ